MFEILANPENRVPQTLAERAIRVGGDVKVPRLVKDVSPHFLMTVTVNFGLR